MSSTLQYFANLVCKENAAKRFCFLTHCQGVIVLSEAFFSMTFTTRLHCAPFRGFISNLPWSRITWTPHISWR